MAAAAVIPVDRTDLVDRRWWFVAALVLCLVGDVLLMLPRDLFVPGLAAFLGRPRSVHRGPAAASIAAGIPPFSFSTTGLVVAAVVVVAVEAAPGTLLLRSLLARGERALVPPVCVYMAAIVTMVVLAVNVGVVTAAVGAILFLASDTLLAWNRFVRTVPHGDLGVHVTYHLAQGLLVLSLVH